MAKVAPDSKEAHRIDAAMAFWRQGDAALQENWFIHAGDSVAPLSEVAAEVPDAGPQALTTEVDGLVLVTQTCDVVRSCTLRPYVEVSPLILVNENDMNDIEKGRRPALATLPALASKMLAADLDRVMTVEKSLIATWSRTPTYVYDSDARRFAQSLARKRARFAFPDDFSVLMRKLQRRIVDKHERDTDEGLGLRALHEIRIHCTPSWEAPSVHVHIFFIREGEMPDFQGKSWSELLTEWLKLVPASGRFKTVTGHVSSIEDLTAAEYVDSDRLDLDHLSTGSAA